jgi:hypothetical protein
LRRGDSQGQIGIYIYIYSHREE